jgi:hypothetical protein
MVHVATQAKPASHHSDETMTDSRLDSPPKP